MEKRGDLYVFTKTKDLASYVITITEKSPKKFRFTLVNRLQNYILDALENLYFANKERDKDKRLSYQVEAGKLLSTLIYFSEIACSCECILDKQYENISKYGAECIKYLKAWIKSDEKRYQSLLTKSE